MESFTDLSVLKEYRQRVGLASELLTQDMDSDQDITVVPTAGTYVTPRSPNSATSEDQDVEETDNDEEMEEDEYEVEAIINHQLSDPSSHPPELGNTPVMLYKVRWKGYEEATWEPATSFEDWSILNAYSERFCLPEVAANKNDRKDKMKKRTTSDSLYSSSIKNGSGEGQTSSTKSSYSNDGTKAGLAEAL